MAARALAEERQERCARRPGVVIEARISGAEIVTELGDDLNPAVRTATTKRDKSTYYPSFTLLANIFPLSEGADFDGSCRRPQAHGLTERYNARGHGPRRPAPGAARLWRVGLTTRRYCMPTVSRSSAPTRLAFVIFEEPKRRHLDGSQRAMVRANCDA